MVSALTRSEALVHSQRQKGITQREIAENLGLSIRTIQLHCQRINRKLKLPSRPYSDARYVYFARASNGLIKVGVAVDYKQRVKIIHSHSPISVELIGARRTPNALQIEHDLLDKYKGDVVKGEWLNPSPMLEAEIRSFLG